MRWATDAGRHAMTVAPPPGKPNCVSRTAISSRKPSLARASRSEAIAGVSVYAVQKAFRARPTSDFGKSAIYPQVA